MSDLLEAPPVTQPSRRTGWRRHRTTLLIAAFLVVAVLVVVFFGNNTTKRSAALDPDNPGPGGAQAVARVLADQGVDVSIVRSADELGDTEVGADTTVVVTSTGQLGTSTVDRLRRHAAGAEIVLVDPSSGVISAFDLDSYPAELDTSDPLAADCGVDRYDGLEIEVDDADGFDPAEAGGEGCFGDSDSAALVSTGDLTLLGAGQALSNDQVLRGDNAAVALRLLGGRDRLVWYVASYDDLVGDDGVGVGSLLPDWIEPGLGMLALAAIVLVLWRVRRLGPLATEPLPVSVKAIETTRSRGRLYRKAGDRAHAARALRVAAAARAATRLRLGRGTDEDTLVRDVARQVRRPDDEVRWLLSPSAPAPASDRDLIHLARALAELEEEVRRS